MRFSGSLQILSGLLCYIVLIHFLWFKSIEASFLRNAEIFNIGWIFSMPYDIGNLLRAPLAGPLSLILSAGLSVVMFFGLITSPVYYLLGTPKRKYHVEDAIRKRPLFLPSPSKNAKANGRSFFGPEGLLWENVTAEEEAEVLENDIPDFVDNVFRFFPQFDENCNKLMVCHAHGFLAFLPPTILQFYRVFSSKMVGIPIEYQMAIVTGLEDQGSCSAVFNNCTTDISTIARTTFVGLILGDLDDLGVVDLY